MNVSKVARSYVENLEHDFQRLRYSMRKRGFSRFNEEQILGKYVRTLLPNENTKTLVDIGAGDGVRWSNTYWLLLRGWKGIGVEADGIERDFGVLSLDIDGNDYWVLKAILSQFRPKLVVTEINENIPPPLRFVVKFEPDFQLRHHFFGYSIATLADLCQEFDYGILELEYNNAFLAPRESVGVEFGSAESAYARGYRDRADRKEKFDSNHDMEVLHSLSPEKAIEFLHEFYGRERGNYYLAVDEESLAQVTRKEGQ
jgi:hypothetical protein